MAFEWFKMYKHEENIERDVTDRVYEYVCEFYSVESIIDLTEEQIDEIERFMEDNVNEYNVMSVGFSNLLHDWDSENSYTEDEYED